MDSFYTPYDLSHLLVSSCSSKAPRRIVDFAAGDGALLTAAAKRWPNAEISAMDVDGVAIKSLGSKLPKALLKKQDFFVFSEKNSSKKTQKSDNYFDVILLNPPFSCRGNTSIAVDLDGLALRGSRALAFVARSLAYLRENGELIAILPSSCVTSERDEDLRNALYRRWKVELLGVPNSAAFPSCSVTINLVRITRRKSGESQPPAQATLVPEINRGRLLLMRGSTANAKGNSTPDGHRFIHSTDLIRGVVASPTRWTLCVGRVVGGTAVLLPRVGRSNIDKIALKRNISPIVLSDCVIALKTREANGDRELMRQIRRNWNIFGGLWTGSCAPFVTMKKLAAALESIGYSVEIVTDMAAEVREVKQASRRPVRSSLPEICALRKDVERTSNMESQPVPFVV